MMSVVQKLKDNIKNNQLHVRSNKCAIFYERRSGNRWFKAKKDVRGLLSLTVPDHVTFLNQVT